MYFDVFIWSLKYQVKLVPLKAGGQLFLAVFLLSLPASLPPVLFSSAKKELKMGIENI